jgi:two-component system, OmpR family, osmolarity sensor histidine kinase EnvZ
MYCASIVAYMIAERPHLLLVWTGAVSFVLVVIAVLFLRNQIRPIRQLAHAAEAFGRGQTLDKFQPSGALEIRQAAREFLKMRARIERMVEQRTQMLLGISHDLRTPLTRMKLTLALQDDDLETTSDLRRDVQQMEMMLNTFLDFGQKKDEVTQEVKVKPVLEMLAYDTRRLNPACTLKTWYLSEIDEQTSVQLKPYGIKRCLQNLLENACSFGDTVHLSVKLLPKRIEFFVEDNGCGIPESQREEAFSSFNRLDEARNQNRSGGVGLGLTIARDIVHSHGGDIELRTGKNLGGLEVFISIPQ